MKDRTDNTSFITSNNDKFQEMKELFESCGLELSWIKKNIVEIQADTLEEVVEYSLKDLGMQEIFLEDAGFFIDSLNGFPGVYSRYVFDTIGNNGILKLLGDADNRRANFVAVIGYKSKEGEDIKLFKGEIKGNVSRTAKGNEGFGYDPIFIPEGFERTFAEDRELKLRLSHRTRAAEQLIKHLKRD